MIMIGSSRCCRLLLNSIMLVVLSFLFVSDLLANTADRTPIEFKAAKNVKWGFEGAFGTYDRKALQRGYQVYKEVCSACHSLNLVHFRDLKALGYSKDQIKAFASSYEVAGDINEDGEQTKRKATLTDRFVAPFPNEKAARAANNGALPPDLSLITKARKDGHNYLYHLLKGYLDSPPAGVSVGDGMYYNIVFKGNQIAMAPPLSDGMIEYQDGTKATVDQMARDVVEFLAWAADPYLEDRHKMGIRFMIFIIILIALSHLSMQRVWGHLYRGSEK